jgi:hypothetical protein
LKDQLPQHRSSCENLDGVLVRADRHRLLVDDAPASGFSTISCSVTPVSVSPLRIAQLSGARPRNFGSSEPCML